MVRNDYRRAFIMLRAAVQGYGGHVRLEKRTLTGNMYFIVTAPQDAGPLYAALAGQRDGQYYATPLGALSRDRRGQLTLARQFDPRSIDGRPLEAYAWVAVAAAGDGRCALALTGNVEGSRELDPAALKRAVCALFDPREVPAADLPEPDAPPARSISIEQAAPDVSPATDAAPTAAECPAPHTAPEIAEPPASAETTPATAVTTTPAPVVTTPATAVRTPPEPVITTPHEPQTEAAPESDIRIYTRVREARAAGQGACAPATDAAPAADGAAATGIAPVADGAAASGVAPAAEAAAPQAPSQTAAQALGLDITKSWVPPAEGLRRLFATQVPIESPLGGGFVYIAGSLPGGSGAGDCRIGLRAADGQITGIRYALPGRFSTEPPAGLEDYRWDDAGYWVLDIGIS